MALFWAVSIGLCVAVLTAPNPFMRSKRQGNTNRGWNSGRTNSGRTYQGGATWNSGPSQGQDYPSYQDTNQQGWNQQQSQGQGQDSWNQQQGQQGQQGQGQDSWNQQQGQGQGQQGQQGQGQDSWNQQQGQQGQQGQGQGSWGTQQGGQGGQGGQGDLGRQGQADAMCQNPTGTNAINCTSFALCQDGVVMGVQTCGSERGQMKFNPDTGECDWAANVPCDAPQLAGDERCSNIPQGFEQYSYFVPDPTYCNMFFVCAHGNYVGTRNCALGEIFDEVALNCTRGGAESCTKQILPFENLH